MKTKPTPAPLVPADAPVEHMPSLLRGQSMLLQARYQKEQQAQQSQAPSAPHSVRKTAPKK